RSSLSPAGLPPAAVSTPSLHDALPISAGWSANTRLRMLPWVMSYYLNPAAAAKRIAAQMVPYVGKAVNPDHQLIHNHRIGREFLDRKSTRLNSSHGSISYAVFCLKKKI